MTGSDLSIRLSAVTLDQEVRLLLHEGRFDPYFATPIIEGKVEVRVNGKDLMAKAGPVLLFSAVAAFLNSIRRRPPGCARYCKARGISHAKGDRLVMFNENAPTIRIRPAGRGMVDVEVYLDDQVISTAAGVPFAAWCREVKRLGWQAVTSARRFHQSLTWAEDCQEILRDLEELA